MNSNQLFSAHKQWRDRPADERFYSLRELHEVVAARRAASVASRVRLNQLRFESAEQGGKADLVLAGQQSLAVPSHWAFHQLAELAGVGTMAPHLRRMPPELVAANLNWAVRAAPREEMSMLWANGSAPGLIRCFTTLKYGRLWDSDVVAWLRRMTADETNGWKRPPAMTDNQYPSGIYGGDRNIFVFLVNDARRLEDGSKEGLGRGFFCWNSEVRQMSFGFKAFLYRYVCGNHIVWGAEELFDLRMIHLGEGMSDRAQRELARVVAGYLEAPAAEQQAVINAARGKALGKTKDEALEFLTSKRAGFNQKEAGEIVLEAVQTGGDPTNLWTVVNSATALSQRKFAYQDERNAWDRKASRLLEVVF